MSKNHQLIAILDFGSQYTHLIARRFRQLGVLAKIYPPDYDFTTIINLIGIVFSGSPASVNENSYSFNSQVFDLKLPVLGLCFGHQLIAKYFGGRVKANRIREYGKVQFTVGQSILFDGLEGMEIVWMSHGDSVIELPPDFQIIGGTENCPIAAMVNEAKKIYTLQFHPEVTHTVHGLKILENFAFKICRATKDWQIEDFKKKIFQQIKEQVGKKKVFLLVSGGVDSTVCFAFLEQALNKEQVYGLHIDTGLMRKDEVEQVVGSLGQAGFKNLHVKDASAQFLSKLKGIIDPEEKRKIIGQLFIDIQEQVSQELNLNPDEWLLAQGTIYPDTIETAGTEHADKIKTHHNRVDKVQQLISEGRIIEPIRDLYKDEVRELGKSLGLSEKIIWRQPFPGPGLAIRALCYDGQSAISNEQLTKINQHLSEILEEIKVIEELPAAVTILALPIRSVGVQGDCRTYANPAVLEFPRLPSASPLANGGQVNPNFQSFAFAQDKLPNKSQILKSEIQNIDWLKIEKISPEITNKIKDVNRVLLRIKDSGLRIDDGTLIEATVTKWRLDLLREIDAIVQEEVFKAKPSGQGRSGRRLERDIWQFPVVLIPFGIDGKESVVLRPVSSLEAMTARFYPLPQEVLESIVKKIEALNQTSFIFYDVTNKPPGTIEWE